MIELKPVERTDGEFVFRTWGSHPENFAYLTARVFSDVTDADRYVAELFSTPESLAFHILEPASGIIGIVKAAVLGHRAQIGYVVHQPFWGRGFATTAVQRVTEMVEALPEIARVWATCALENPASVRVLEKCGYEREAILKNWVIYPAQGRGAFDNYSYVKLPRSAG